MREWGSKHTYITLHRVIIECSFTTHAKKKDQTALLTREIAHDRLVTFFFLFFSNLPTEVSESHTSFSSSSSCASRPREEPSLSYQTRQQGRRGGLSAFRYFCPRWEGSLSSVVIRKGSSNDMYRKGDRLRCCTCCTLPSRHVNR